MPSLEQEPERQEGQEQREQEQQPYYRVSRFRDGRASSRIHFAAQDIIATTQCDLSSYRFLLREVWHVAVLGQQPPEAVDKQLEAILSTGQPVTLPDDILKYLFERRSRATRLGNWVEGHYQTE